MRFSGAESSRVRGRMEPKKTAVSKLNAWMITVPWIEERIWEEEEQSLVWVKMGLRRLRDVWAARFRAVTHKYGRRLGSMGIGSWLVSSESMRKLKDMRRSSQRGWEEMKRSGVENVKEERCKQNKAGCTCPPCTVLKVLHGIYLGGTIPSVDYMRETFRYYAMCSQHDCKCQIWPWAWLEDTTRFDTQALS